MAAFAFVPKRVGRLHTRISHKEIEDGIEFAITRHGRNRWGPNGFKITDAFNRASPLSKDNGREFRPIGGCNTYFE